MIGRYNLPSDDILAAYWDTVVITASDEDPAYPLTNWGDRKPAKPSKLTTTSGWWEFDFGVAVNVAVVSAIYHNFDAGLPVIWKWNSSSSWSSPMGSQELIVPAWTEEQDTISPWEALDSTPTARFWRLEVALGSPGNSYPLKLGRPYLGGALREIETDVRWGVTEEGESEPVRMETQLGVESIYAIGSERQRFNGEMGLYDAEAEQLISLYRAAKRSVLPWLLIPQVNVNKACFVRFPESKWSRTWVTINHNSFPFRVQELSRGIDWP